MRRLSRVLIAALTTSTVAAVAPAPADARPPKPRAELVTKQVTASIVAGKVSAAATVKNKGNKTAGPSVATFYLSADAKPSADDSRLGTARVGRIKAKRSKPVRKSFAVLASVVPGTYHVVVCADSGGAVKERKETNNCKGSRGTINVTGATSGPVTVSATAGAGGSVAASGVTVGTCVATTCTFPSPGAGTVTFTPTAAAGYRFGGWSGVSCLGFTPGPVGAITFTNPTANKACTAAFVKQVTISYVASPLPALGTVSGEATHGTCTATTLLVATGSCVVDAGVGTVTLTASPVLPIPGFGGWTGATCNGTAAANVMTFTAPASDKACTANFL